MYHEYKLNDIVVLLELVASRLQAVYTPIVHAHAQGVTDLRDRSVKPIEP